MKKFGLVRKADGLRNLAEKTLRGFRHIPFLFGTLLREKNAQGEEVGYVTVTTNQNVMFRHGLSRAVRGALVLDALATLGAGRFSVIRFRENLNDEDLSEFVTLYFPASSTFTVELKIWVW